MGTLHRYFEMDFPRTARFHVNFEVQGVPIQARIHYDFHGYYAFISCYVEKADLTIGFFKEMVRHLDYGKTQFKFDGRIKLPSVKQFPGILHIQNDNPPFIKAQFFGDPGWISTADMQASRRLFIYSETDLSESEIIVLKEKGAKNQHQIQFRSKTHLAERSKWEKPIADSALLSAKLLKKGTLKVYEKFPHGMSATHADVINADLLSFIKA